MISKQPSSLISFALWVTVILRLDARLSAAFVVPRSPTGPSLAYSLSSSSSPVETENHNVLLLTLSKPLGMILEENEEGQAAGVFVKDFAESGSALEYRERIVGATLTKVGATDVTMRHFDEIIELIGAADDAVQLEFVNLKPETVVYDVGTKVTITIQQMKGEDLEFAAAVGDNLRAVMLENGVEVYQGLKQKLGNCGGAGQCTFCAVDFITSEGWAERSDYEDKKLSKFPTARLACLNNIQGPATIRKTER